MSEWLDALDAWHAMNSHLVRALLAGSLVSIVCGVIGCFVILRRMAFLGDAIAHAMLAGVVAGYLFMKLVFGAEAHAPAMLFGSLLAGLITVGMIGFVARMSRIKEDTAIGIMYTGIFAAGGLLASLFSQYVHLDLLHFVTGSVLAVEMADLWMIGFVTVFVVAVVVLFFRALQLTSFDPVMAASIGIPVVAVDYLLTVCTSMVVVSAVNIVGVIQVVGMLVTPAATAYLLCDRLQRMLWASAGFAISSFLVGYWLSTAINVAPGSSIVVASSAQFLLVLAVAPRYGLISDWLRRRQMVPQQLVEDVLSCVLKALGSSVDMSVIYEHVAGQRDRIRDAVRALERKALLECRGEVVRLTEAGEREARRLLRAHRLWETYLQRLGTPTVELHAHAHRLEHLHDEDAVDYLDDQLGHPLLDPHGKEIPEDFVHLRLGATVKASLLRQGWRARVVRVVGSGGGDARIPATLQPGVVVSMGKRSAGGQLWELHLDSGSAVALDHQAADALLVEVLEAPRAETVGDSARSANRGDE